MFGPLAPTLTVFAGPNGAGQTTLMRQRVAHVMGLYVRVWPAEEISWPETWAFSRLRADGRYVFSP